MMIRALIFLAASNFVIEWVKSIWRWRDEKRKKAAERDDYMPDLVRTLAKINESLERMGNRLGKQEEALDLILSELRHDELTTETLRLMREADKNG